MKNTFKNHIRKTESKLIMKLLLIVLFILALVLIYLFSGIPYALISFLISAIFYIIFTLMQKKEDKIMEKYGISINTNTYIGLKSNHEFLLKLCNILEVPFILPKTKKPLVEYIDYLINKNKMIFINKNFKLDNVITLINEFLKNNNYDLFININDILIKDTYLIREKREKNINNDLNDFSSINEILENNGYELIIFYARNEEFSKLARIDGYIITIATTNKYYEFRNLY